MGSDGYSTDSDYDSDYDDGPMSKQEIKYLDKVADAVRDGKTPPPSPPTVIFDTNSKHYKNGSTFRQFCNMISRPPTETTIDRPAYRPVLAIFHALGGVAGGDLEKFMNMGVDLNETFRRVFDTQRFCEELGIQGRTWREDGNVIRMSNLLEQTGLPYGPDLRLHNAGNDAYWVSRAVTQLLASNGARLVPGLSPRRIREQWGGLIAFVDTEWASLPQGKDKYGRKQKNLELLTEIGVTVIDTLRTHDWQGGFMAGATSYHALIADNIDQYCTMSWSKPYNTNRFDFRHGPSGRIKERRTVEPSSGYPVTQQIPVDSVTIKLSEAGDWFRSIVTPQVSSSKL